MPMNASALSIHGGGPLDQIDGLDPLDELLKHYEDHIRVEVGGCLIVWCRDGVGQTKPWEFIYSDSSLWGSNGGHAVGAGGGITIPWASRPKDEWRTGTCFDFILAGGVQVCGGTNESGGNEFSFGLSFGMGGGISWWS